MLKMRQKTIINKRVSNKFLRQLKRIPGYAGILAEKHDLSRITIYRILRGDSSPKSLDVLDDANKLIREYEARIVSLTNSIKNESRN